MRIVVEDVSPHVRVIALNREARRNALDVQAARMLTQALVDADSDKAVRVVVLTGKGSAFCSGADLQELVATSESEIPKAFGELFRTIHHLGVPLIAAVNGAAIGGGFGLLLASDMAVVAEDAKLGTPEAERGLFPLVISRFLYENLPQKLAHEILFLGKMLPVARALELGVVNRVVAKDRVLPEALQLAEQIASHSGAVLRLGRKALKGQMDDSFDGAMTFLETKLVENIGLKDAREGISAFLEKRKPRWKDG